eukprot:g1800.t1
MSISLFSLSILVLCGQSFASDCLNGPCKPGNDQCGAPMGSDSPQFHVVDKSCGINDPNGPVFDPVHSMYHLFYQDHLAMDPGHGPIYGHAVSRDLIHWAHLPVAIWNDQPYDNEAIFTGSATVVDGKVVQIYPGLCNKNDWPSCSTGTNLAIAVPADYNDPLLTNWSKPAYNPIFNGTQRDPSTAWQTPDGEWRLTTFDTIIYGSMDFKTWYKIGKQPNFPGGECPSFFPLPRFTPGSVIPKEASNYTHVHKASHGGDWMQVGHYTPNGVKSAGVWVGEPEVKIDMGHFYASKDFYDPVKKRRINWGWATVPPKSAQTLPREITWNAELHQLVYSPLEEQAALRGDTLGDLKAVALTAGQPKCINCGSSDTLAKGNQSEIFASFQLPKTNATFGFVVNADSDATTTGTYFFVQYDPSSLTATVGAVAGGTKGDFSKATKDTLKLSPNDKSLDLRVYIDRTFSEAFWMNGRVAMTIDTAGVAMSSHQLVSSVANLVFEATVWEVKSIWVSTEEVLNTPVPKSM